MRIPVLIGTLCTAATLSAGPADGEALMSELRDSFRPVSLVRQSQVFESVETVDACPGGVLDRFGDTPLTTPLATCGSYTYILPATWWRDNAPSRDLHNIVACNIAVPALRGDLPPGAVDTPSYSDSHWCVGTTYVTDVPVDYYQPPRGYEGDFARAALYVITMYGDMPLNGGNAYNFVAMNSYPGILGGSLRQLLAWHDSDPVDEFELSRDSRIAAIQGNHNPYVTDPSLVRRVFEPTVPDTPPQPVPAEPLRATYTIADSHVTLMSPYIADDAVWYVDGVRTDDRSIATSALGVGRHMLRYETADAVGELIIEIVP